MTFGDFKDASDNLSLNRGEETANDNTQNRVYYDLGKSNALNSKVSLSNLTSSLDIAYSEFCKREKNFTKERIAQYEGTINNLKKDTREREADIAEFQLKKELNEEQISDIKEEIAKVKSEGKSVDYLPTIIGGVLLILLSLYLFMFYASTGFSAFFGNPSKIVGGFLVPTVFGDAIKYGSGALGFIILFPIVFLAMGFLIHITMDKKQYFGLIALLVFTLAFDSFMAYKIAKNSHDLEFALGNTEENWNMSMAIENVDFYIVIAAGFVVYIIWGFLLHYVISEQKRNAPDNVKRVAIEKLQEERIKLTEVGSELAGKLTDLEEFVVKNGLDIKVLEGKIIDLRSGKSIIDINALKGMVGSFLGGWTHTITFLYENQPEEAEILKEKSNTIGNDWFDNFSNTSKS